MSETPRGDERLVRIEEAEAFNARQLELLHDAVLELGGKIEQVAARMRQLEARLEAQHESDETPDEDEHAS